MEIWLHTRRLLLRRFTPSDAENLIALDSDPEVMRFLTGGRATPREAIERDILPRFLRSDPHEPTCGFWAAASKGDGEFLGWFGLQPCEGEGSEEVELGYRLRRAAWGRGYATEGARALLRKGFTELGVLRVVATTYEENVASRRVLEKLGMTPVRRFRPTPEELTRVGTFDGTGLGVWEGDDVEYALERSAWAEREAEGAS